MFEHEIEQVSVLFCVDGGDEDFGVTDVFRGFVGFDFVLPVDPFSFHVEVEIEESDFFVWHGFFYESSEFFLEYFFGFFGETGSKRPDDGVDEDGLEFVGIRKVFDVEERVKNFGELDNDVEVSSGEGKIEDFDGLISIDAVENSGHEDGNVSWVDFVHGGDKLSEFLFVFGELEHPFVPVRIVT